MRFVSTKLVNGARLSADAPFDVEFIKNVRLEDGKVIAFDYLLSDFRTNFPVDTSEALIVVKLTNNHLYPSAVVYIDGDEELFPHLTDGVLECEIQMCEP